MIQKIKLNFIITIFGVKTKIKKLSKKKIQRKPEDL
jgi:hypothetical protein